MGSARSPLADASSLQVCPAEVSVERGVQGAPSHGPCQQGRHDSKPVACWHTLTMPGLALQEFIYIQRLEPSLPLRAWLVVRSPQAVKLTLKH